MNTPTPQTEARLSLSAFKIPGSTREADAFQGQLGELACATGWTRAAIVYASVTVSTHGGDRSKPKSGLAAVVSPIDYAKKRFAGLTSPETVRRHQRAWQLAVDDGIAKPVGLGDDVALPPATSWDEYYRRAGQPKGKPHPDEDDNVVNYPAHAKLLDGEPADINSQLRFHDALRQISSVLPLGELRGRELDCALDSLSNAHRELFGKMPEGDRNHIEALIGHLERWASTLQRVLTLDRVLSVKCPQCQAAPGLACRIKGGYHVRRANEAGITFRRSTA